MKRVDYIQAALSTWTQERPSKTYKTLAPSSLGGCPRAHFLKLVHVSETTPARPAAQVGFEVGRVWEAFMAKVLQDQGLLAHWYRDGVDEPFMHEGLNLGGTPDYLLKGGIVADCKTMRSDYFWNMEREYLQLTRTSKGQAIPTKAEWWAEKNEQYVTQIGAYMVLMRHAGIQVDKGLIFFASKNDGFIGMELEVPYTEELERDIVARCNFLNQCLKTGTLPTCTCEGWKINYCDFGDPTSLEEKQIRQTKNKKLVATRCCDPSLYREEAS